MSKINDGGTAFPVIPPVDETGRTAVGYPYPDPGMSLRDWFAGQALHIPELRGETPQRVADWAYSLADAMLAEREKGGA
jgi:hypothetical protein